MGNKEKRFRNYIYNRLNGIIESGLDGIVKRELVRYNNKARFKGRSKDIIIKVKYKPLKVNYRIY